MFLLDGGGVLHMLEVYNSMLEVAEPKYFKNLMYGKVKGIQYFIYIHNFVLSYIDNVISDGGALSSTTTSKSYLSFKDKKYMYLWQLVYCKCLIFLLHYKSTLIIIQVNCFTHVLLNCQLFHQRGTAAFASIF